MEKKIYPPFPPIYKKKYLSIQSIWCAYVRDKHFLMNDIVENGTDRAFKGDGNRRARGSVSELTVNSHSSEWCRHFSVLSFSSWAMCSFGFDVVGVGLDVAD